VAELPLPGQYLFVITLPADYKSYPVMFCLLLFPLARKRQIGAGTGPFIEYGFVSRRMNPEKWG
jgi:hypothetical protein